MLTFLPRIVFRGKKKSPAKTALNTLTTAYNSFIYLLILTAFIYISMHEAQVNKIIKKAVQRERRLWLSLFALAFISTLYRTPVQVVDNGIAFQKTKIVPVNRRMLQATSSPEAETPVAAPSSENSELAILPSAEENSSLLQDSLAALTPSPEAEYLNLALSPAIEEPLPLRNSSEIAPVQEECTCPPGPKVRLYFYSIEHR
jgi:hypothetical protein